MKKVVVFFMLIVCFAFINDVQAMYQIHINI